MIGTPVIKELNRKPSRDETWLTNKYSHEQFFQETFRMISHEDWILNSGPF